MHNSHSHFRSHPRPRFDKGIREFQKLFDDQRVRATLTIGKPFDSRRWHDKGHLCRKTVLLRRQPRFNTLSNDVNDYPIQIWIAWSVDRSLQYCPRLRIDHHHRFVQTAQIPHNVNTFNTFKPTEWNTFK